MKHAFLACLSLTVLAQTFDATAQEQLSLDEYFRGTGIELNAATRDVAQPMPQLPASPPAPTANTFARPAPTLPLRPLPPAQPQRAKVDLSQIDPLTGLPNHLTSRGAASPSFSDNGRDAVPFPDAVLRASGTVGVPALGAPPAPTMTPWPNVMTPPQAFIPPPAVRVAQGPIILEGRIEPLDMSLVPPLPSSVDRLATNEFEGVYAPPPREVAERVEDFQIASSQGHDPDWIGEITNPPNDRCMNDLCISRKGFVALDHWGWHASALAGRRDSLGITSASGNMTVGFPKLENLTVRPSFGFHALSGPQRTDLPGVLHDLQIEAGWRQQLHERLSLRVAATTGLYSDFDQSSLSGAVRVSGLALLAFEATEDLQLVLGAAYLNLETRSALPIVGVVYHPDDDTRLELLFPEAKLARRISQTDACDRWAYLGTQFFGRTWHIGRSSGLEEDVTYTDWRLSLGLETKLVNHLAWYVEVGAAFNRELTYESHIGDYDPDTTGFLRGGIYY